MSNCFLPSSGSRFTIERFTVDKQFTFSCPQQTHQNIKRRAFATTCAANNPDSGSAGDDQIKTVNHPWSLGNIPKPHIVKPYFLGEFHTFHRRLGLRLREGLIQQINRVVKRSMAPSDGRPGTKDLLQCWQQPLRTQCQRAQHRQSCSDTSRLPADYKGQGGNKHHSQRFHHKPRATTDKYVISQTAS